MRREEEKPLVWVDEPEAQRALPRAVREKVYVVIAAFNEEQTVGAVVEELKDLYPRVVVVDDGSSDRTRERAIEAGAMVLRHVVNRGQGASLQTGIDFALDEGAEQVVTFDADGQHSVGAISRLLEPILSGEVAVALGSRFLEDADAVPWSRRVLLSIAVLFTRLTSGARLGDAHNGLRAMSRQAASAIEIRLDRMAHASDLVDQIHRSGLPYTEVPVRISYTAYSRAKGQRWSATFGVAFDYLVGKLLR